MPGSMHWLVAAVVASLLCCLPGLSRADVCDRIAEKSPQAKEILAPPPTEIPGTVSHVYKTVAGTDLKLFVIAPTGATRAPKAAVVIFYGGGWLFGNPSLSVPLGQYIAGRGAVAILADYRAYCRARTVITDQMADANAAMIWVRSHAAELGVDPHRIAAFGGSSGGHLAASAAVFKSTATIANGKQLSSRPDLLVLFYPCVDETSPFEKQSADAFGGHGKDVSPLYHVTPGLPPTVIFQGTKDPLYPSTKAFCAEVRTMGGRCRFVEIEGADHGFFASTNPGPFRDIGLKGMDEYLTRAGYLPASVEKPS